MYFSTYHWLPILNGYSGYIPDSYPALMEHAARLPDPGALRVLVDCAGLRWILLRDAGPGARAAWQRPAGVKLRGEFARVGSRDDLLYEVEWRPAAPCPLEAVPPSKSWSASRSFHTPHPNLPPQGGKASGPPPPRRGRIEEGVIRCRLRPLFTLYGRAQLIATSW
jgi:hypothetical protein